jgi:hypothetical protein
LSPTTPRVQRLPAITHPWFGLFRFRSPLLTESLLFSLPVGTEMFHFPTFPPLTLCVQVRVTPHHWGRVSPFGHPRITARLTAPRGLSQPPTSFIGSWCQGIHRAPLQTWPQRCSRPLCSSQTTHGKPPHTPPPTPTTPHHHPEAARGRDELMWPAAGAHTTTRKRHAGDDELMWPAAGTRNQETHPTKRVFSQDPTVHRCPPPPPDHTGPDDDAGTCQRSTHERTPRTTNAHERGHILHSSPPPVPCHHPPRKASAAGTGRDGHRQAL